MSDLYKIGIVGYGVVGKGIHKLFKEAVYSIYDPVFPNHGHEILPGGTHSNFVYIPEYHKLLINNKKYFKDLDLVVISVPTNENEDWSADTSILEESVKWVFNQGVHTILIKSTTPPTVLKKLHSMYDNVVFSPEYMGESKYFTPEWKYPHPQNMASHTWQTFGGSRKHTNFCVDIFKRRMGVDTEYWQTDITTAGLAKYIENSFFAMKVTFCNEFRDVAEMLGVDWNELRELWLQDPRINRNHTLVFPRDRGYGGKCFPKDTRAIIKEMRDLGYEASLMVAMDKVNQKMREKNVY